MKHFIKLITIITLLITFSCNLQEVNENPNAVIEAPVTVLLPPAQASMANALMNENSATVGIFLQYFEPNNNTQYSPYAEYFVDNSFYVEDIWYDYYVNALVQIKDIIEKSESAGAYHYTGIAQIMMAWTLGTVTDNWGDVPYSTALQGSLALTPTYDAQSDIYEDIFELLNDGIANLDKESTMDASDYDILYGGNVTLWKKAAYGLIARYSLHVVNKSAEVGFDPLQQTLNAVQNSYDYTDMPLAYEYGYDEADKSPYNIGKNNTDLVINDYFKTLVASHPSKDGITKTQLGSADTGPYLSDLNAKAYFVTPWEVKFIEAEARLRTNTTDPLIQTALREAVEAFLTEVAPFDDQLTTDSISSYVSHITLTGNYEADLETIMMQKYISMFGQVEQWSDFRRTGYPALIPNPNGTSAQNPNGEIPRRYPYPQNEMELNGGNVPSTGVNMQARVWWDEE
ncbi:MAG: hypothetical protein C0599_03785 [Salinivirgaceae bacterium]|nr:MAG: hypothetical protein C0599_03785 [Salinivirgaceae bacterium]